MADVAETVNQAVNEGKEGKYLIFNLGNEEYGIGISKTKEIIGMMQITSVPRTPAFVKGVINLRGKVLPVVDLRLKFGMPEMEYTDRTCIIVVEISRGDVNAQTGIVVDAVSEVLSIKGEDIEEAPNFSNVLSTGFILGIAKMEGGVKILLDIDEVLSQEEMEMMSEIKDQGSSQSVEQQPKEQVAETAQQPA